MGIGVEGSEVGTEMGLGCRWSRSGYGNGVRV